MTDTTTSNPNAGVPVLKLHHELLWTIVRMNTDGSSNHNPLAMFEDLFIDHEHHPPLKTMRNYSQVCRDWRNFILQSHSLWGKLFNLEDLQKGSEHWRDEVLRRSGDSLLWIRGSLTGMPKSKWAPIIAFFFSVLNNHWSRIQRLEVNVNSRKTDIKQWRSLYCAAPYLEIFKVDFVGAHKQVLSLSLPLFANDAPSLREYDANAITFNFESSWLSNVRVLHLAFPVSLEHAIRILEMTPRLELLRISQIFETETKTPSPHVYLASLDQMDISGDPATTSKILGHVTAPDGCSISLVLIIDLEDGFLNASARNFAEPLSKFLLGYLHWHRPTSLSFTCSLPFFDLSDTTTRSQGSFFSIMSRCGGFSRELFKTLINLLLNSFQFQVFPSVRELKLDFDFSPPDFLTSFCSGLSYINTLTCEEDTILHLLKIQKDAPDLFPLLSTLKIKHIYLPSFEEVTERAIISFLRLRADAGHPISVLDLSQCDPVHFQPLECLGEMNGLRILWSFGDPDEIFEYNCGSDNTEKLCFPSEW